jgi:hypothetical protein
MANKLAFEDATKYDNTGINGEWAVGSKRGKCGI